MNVLKERNGIKCDRGMKEEKVRRDPQTEYSENVNSPSHGSFMSEDSEISSIASPSENSERTEPPSSVPTDSFVITDSDITDDQSYTNSVSFLSSDNSASNLTRRCQPVRFAKIDLNIPSRSMKPTGIKATSKFESSDCVMESPQRDLKSEKSPGRILLSTLKCPKERQALLEIYPELLSEDEDSPARPTDKTDEKSISPTAVKPSTSAKDNSKVVSKDVVMMTPKRTGLKSVLSPGRLLLSHAKSKEDAELIREIYPEMISDADMASFIEDQSMRDETGYALIFETKEVETEDNVTEDLKSMSFSEVATSTPIRPRPIKKRISHVRASLSNRAEENVDEDSFEKYLNKLKEDKECDESDQSDVVVGDDQFVVDDSIILKESSDEEDYEPVEDSESNSGSDSDADDNRQVRRNNEHKRRMQTSIIEQFNTPSLKQKRSKLDVDELFLASLSHDFEGPRHAEATKYITKGIKTKKPREELVLKLTEIYRRCCFGDQLTEVPVVWNAHLRKTAGHARCSFRENKRNCVIELSPKVCTTAARLRDTLIHEMCHAAAWVITGAVREGHGPIWQKWTDKCMHRFRCLPAIRRCHNYDIEAKFIYACQGCGQLIRRHSRSLDLQKKCCGICKGTFVLKTKSGKEVTEKGNEKANPFAQFVKEHYKKYKTKGVKHGDVMKILSAEWKNRQTEPVITESQSNGTSSNTKRDEVASPSVVILVSSDEECDELETNMSVLSIR